MKNSLSALSFIFLAATFTVSSVAHADAYACESNGWVRRGMKYFMSECFSRPMGLGFSADLKCTGSWGEDAGLVFAMGANQAHAHHFATLAECELDRQEWLREASDMSWSVTTATFGGLKTAIVTLPNN